MKIPVHCTNKGKLVSQVIAQTMQFWKQGTAPKAYCSALPVFKLSENCFPTIPYNFEQEGLGIVTQ